MGEPACRACGKREGQPVLDLGEQPPVTLSRDAMTGARSRVLGVKCMRNRGWRCNQAWICGVLCIW